MDRHTMQVLGHVARTHGVKGELLIKFRSEIELIPGEPVFVDLQGPVPFFIETSRPGSGGMIIRFEWLDTIEKAEKLVGAEIVGQPVENDGTTDEQTVAGFSFKDLNTGKQGTVLELRPLKHQPLLVVEIEGKEVLVPFVEDMIVELNNKDRVVIMDLPNGLLDI